jgi:hypothetical protein
VLHNDDDDDGYVTTVMGNGNVKESEVFFLSNAVLGKYL